MTEKAIKKILERHILNIRTNQTGEELEEMFDWVYSEIIQEYTSSTLQCFEKELRDLHVIYFTHLFENMWSNRLSEELNSFLGFIQSKVRVYEKFFRTDY